MVRSSLLFLLLLSALTFGACRARRPEVPAPLPDSTTAFHIRLENRTSAPETFQISLSGRTVYEGSIAPGARPVTLTLPARPGWYVLHSRSSSGAAHQAAVEGNRTKWIRIRREPAKREGFAVHITEYPA